MEKPMEDSNIISNKLCAIVSRTEPKDFIEFYLDLTDPQLSEKLN